jgi:hypothetical protein
MKPLTPTFAIVCLLTFTYATGQAPPDYSALCKEKMKKIAALAGQWEGEASVSTGPAPAMVITQKEDVQFKIDSTVLVIEGTGTRDGSVVFNAYAVINFNVRSQAYELRSYLKDGHSTDAYFKFLGENKFEWGFEIPGNAGRVRYTITLNDTGNTWREVGEFSRDAVAWMKFMEMALLKKD